MSLDVYLIEKEDVCKCCGRGKVEERVFDANITHNLHQMAREAGLECVWAPEEVMAPEIAARLDESEKVNGYHHETTRTIRSEFPRVQAKQLIELLQTGIVKLRESPEHFRTFEPENKWGTYDDFIPWLEKYLAACEQYPEAYIRVSR